MTTVLSFGTDTPQPDNTASVATTPVKKPCGCNGHRGQNTNFTLPLKTLDWAVCLFLLLLILQIVYFGKKILNGK